MSVRTSVKLAALAVAAATISLLHPAPASASTCILGPGALYGNNFGSTHQGCMGFTILSPQPNGARSVGVEGQELVDYGDDRGYIDFSILYSFSTSGTGFTVAAKCRDANSANFQKCGVGGTIPPGARAWKVQMDGTYFGSSSSSVGWVKVVAQGQF